MPGQAPLGTDSQGQGDARAAAYFPQVYEQLHALAQQWFADQPPDHTLQPTALVHEAYLRLAGHDPDRWRSRTHFYAIAARAMRQVLVDHARRRAAAKRGGQWSRVTLADATGEFACEEIELIALNEALDKLADLNERQSRIVELRFLAGLTVEEAAEALELSTRTVKLDWRMARAWLLDQLREERTG
jgi:RNA polymerase sigma factor (TIGR02999 family)